MFKPDTRVSDWSRLCAVSALLAGLLGGCGDSKPTADDAAQDKADAGRTDGGGLATCDAGRCAAEPDDAGPSQAREQACAAVNTAIATEVDALRVCARAADCGKPLPTLGSCGCSHDAVGRLSADTTRLEALFEERATYSDLTACEDLAGTCDCPPVGGVTCEAERCAWVDVEPADPCASLDGTYTSVDELECGLTPTGVALCHWSLTFTGGTFSWHYSDVGEAGSYACSEGALVASTGGGREYQGTLAEDGSLTFDGVKYTRSP